MYVLLSLTSDCSAHRGKYFKLKQISAKYLYIQLIYSTPECNLTWIQYSVYFLSLQKNIDELLRNCQENIPTGNHVIKCSPAHLLFGLRFAFRYSFFLICKNPYGKLLEDLFRGENRLVENLGFHCPYTETFLKKLDLTIQQVHTYNVHVQYKRTRSTLRNAFYFFVSFTRVHCPYSQTETRFFLFTNHSLH